MTDATFWNNIAEEYRHKPVDNPEAFDRKTEITRSLMKPTDRLLDVGCGTGSLALRLAPGCREIHGLDVSTEMVRIARAKADAVNAANVIFHTGAFDDDFTAPAPGSVDGICAYSLLHLVKDRPAALRRIYELLKPDGYFVSSTVCLGNTWIPYAPMLLTMRWLKKAPYVAIMTTETLKEEMADAGFIDLATPDVGAKETTAFVVAAKAR